MGRQFISIYLKSLHHLSTAVANLSLLKVRSEALLVLIVPQHSSKYLLVIWRIISAAQKS